MSFTEDLARKWGDRIRKARQEQGLSLETLALRVGMDAGHLSRGERGLAGIGDDYRIRLASALGQRVEDLFPYPAETTPCPPASSAADPAALTSSTTTGSTDGTTAPTRASAPAASCATAPAASTPTVTPNGGKR